jgi:hypothetical protein
MTLVDGVLVTVMKATWYMCQTEFTIDICTDLFPVDEIFERCFVEGDTL